MNLKERVEKNEILLGTMISELGCPNLIRMMQTGGFQFVIIDGEHGPFDLTQMAGMVAVGNGIGMPVIIRIPEIDRGFMTKALDMGADGFLIPMVNTADDARQLVEYAKYAPEGKRGISTTRAHTNYNPCGLREYMKSANRRILLMAQIETKEAVKNVEEIAAVSGIDVLIVGPSDLSSDLGVPGQLDAPVLLECAKKITDVALKNGKKCGTVSSNVKYLHACEDMGMSIFSMGSELGMILNGARENITVFRKKEPI